MFFIVYTMFIVSVYRIRRIFKLRLQKAVDKAVEEAIEEERKPDEADIHL